MNITIKQVQLTDQDQLEQLWYLQHIAYRLEAALIGFDQIPPLLENMDDLSKCKEIVYGIFAEEELIAALSYTIDNNELDIARVVVHPDWHRKGMARRLLQHVFALYPEHLFSVWAAEKNTPACELYRSVGFVPRMKQEVAPGVWLQCYEK
ncbi:GNAT family N-acetyltransferase [Marinicrinis lubricantis]|uniref:GNAT family N-acetyltransferase n=1 Tax=Marinicrinis lubricantis TaxID=2086470 RepID=A0ABW1IJF8_9BACL